MDGEKHILNNKTYNILVAAIMLLSFVCYALITLVNHYMFRTYAIDLGIINNAIYSYSHFKFNYGPVFQSEPVNILAVHFNWQLMLISPLGYIFGSYTMLVVQAIAATIGGFGIYKLSGQILNNKPWQILVMLFFYCYFAVWHAMSLNAHSDVVSAMFLPWFLYFFNDKKYKLSTIFLLLIISGGESMALWTFFISLALLFDYKNEKKTFEILLIYTIFSIFYYLIITLAIMPALGGEFALSDWQYNQWGKNIVEVVFNIIKHPIEAFKQLFINTSDNPKYDYVKTEFWLMMLLSGTFFLYSKPNYIIMLIPLIGIKMFSSTPAYWSIAYQYNIGFAPVAAVGVIFAIKNFNNPVIKNITAVSAVVISLLSTIYSINNPKFNHALNRIKFYSDEHYYRPDINVDIARQMIENVDDTSAVSVTSCILPHLAMREKVYSFPDIRDAKYVITKSHPAPPVEGSPEDVENLKKDSQWKIFMRGGDLIMFVRK